MTGKRTTRLAEVPQDVIDLACAQSAGLEAVARMLRAYPQAAPLLEILFRQLMLPLGAVDDPQGATTLLSEAFASAGALVSRADTPDMDGVLASLPGLVFWWFTPGAGFVADVTDGPGGDGDVVEVSEPADGAVAA